MIIGNFSYDADRDTYAGEITTLSLQRSNVSLRPVDKNSEREPDYRIVQEREDRFVELGAAWKRTSERGNDFLSVTLDDPALPSALNAAMFVEASGDIATLVWQRPVKKAPQPEPARPASQARRASAARRPAPA